MINQAIEVKYTMKAKNRLRNKILEESQMLREIQLIWTELNLIYQDKILKWTVTWKIQDLEN